MSEEVKVIKSKTYTFIQNDMSDGTMNLSRTNTGFSPFELLGMCEYVQMEILEQMSGIIKPDVVTRTVVKENEQ